MPRASKPSQKTAPHTKMGSSKPKKSTNPWIILVNKTRREHPEMSLKEAMVYSKGIYAKMKH